MESSSRTAVPDALARLTTALADRYLIERELGAGGMATVYLAQDVKHQRQVAIKVLHPELAASLGAERFLREITTTANLRHPHILPLYDSGEAQGFLYYVMPYVEGESLRDRLRREKQLPLEDALRIAREVADALGYAHARGIVHRDIKPENILLESGHAVVADFGIARAVTAAGTEELTATGTAIGTPVYMSPEQASGERDLDGRSDLYSLGCVVYEMLGGEPPYLGTTPQAVIAKKMSEPTPRISVVRELVPAAVEAAIDRALAKTPADRFATAEQFIRALTMPSDGIAHVPSVRSAEIEYPRAATIGPLGLRSVATRIRQPRVAVPAVGALLALAVFSAWFLRHRAEVRWAREVAIPEIERLIGENDVWRNLVPPYQLAEQAEAILGNDPKLAALFSQVSMAIDVETDPPGARIYMKEYEDPDGGWTYLGVSPLERVRVPTGIFRWKIEKEGYQTVLAAASSWTANSSDDKTGFVPNQVVRTLDRDGSIPPGTVRVQGAETAVGKLPDFFIDKYEVTNRQYKEFIDAGGYRNRDYWKHPFVADGQLLTWDQAMRLLVDQSDQPGPATWLGGDYPPGQAEYPVSGVSWYEAAAYAEYAGKSLPTDAHWNVARGGLTPMLQFPQLGGFAVLAPFANFGDQGPVPVRSLPGITAFGAYDMAGNVREWCWNETPQGRLIRGGAWSDNTYAFNVPRQAPPMDRSPRNGFRLAVYPDPDAVPEAAYGTQTTSAPGDYLSRTPVSDAIFEVYRDQFSYDDTALNARVEYRRESPGGWIQEKISFDAAYGGERVVAYLFLPSHVPAPFQTVIYWPGSASIGTRSSQDLESYYEFPMFLSFLVRSGRAVLYPVYKGTFERGSPATRIVLNQLESRAYSELVVQDVKDLGRSIDYLETRQDIDSGKLAYYGMSWGAVQGPIALAVEQRFGAGVLLSGGFMQAGTRPEVDQLNYVTGVRTPTLMMNGKYDSLFEIAERVEPMFDLLGTPAQQKRLILSDTDHIPPRAEFIKEILAWAEFIKEILAWLDEYLGPVG
jgi:formylglycine-generating enzyme required for sulfatase activity/tRNA A-37 threonylcarbamoyl transferase component Bud32/dienelactone hydrolase